MPFLLLPRAPAAPPATSEALWTTRGVTVNTTTGVATLPSSGVSSSDIILVVLSGVVAVPTTLTLTPSVGSVSTIQAVTTVTNEFVAMFSATGMTNSATLTVTMNVGKYTDFAVAGYSGSGIGNVSTLFTRGGVSGFTSTAPSFTAQAADSLVVDLWAERNTLTTGTGLTKVAPSVGAIADQFKASTSDYVSPNANITGHVAISDFYPGTTSVPAVVGTYTDGAGLNRSSTNAAAIQVEVLQAAPPTAKSASDTGAISISGSASVNVSGTQTLVSMMNGGVTATSAKVRLDTTGVTTGAVVRVATDTGLTTGVVNSSSSMPDADGLSIHSVTGLTPNTDYYYAAVLDGNVMSDRGTFRTHDSTAVQSFSFTASSCCTTAADPIVLDAIRTRTGPTGQKARFFAHLGDFEYRDVSATTASTYLTHFRGVMAKAKHKALFNAIPLEYTLSDHDFAGDNTSGAGEGSAVVDAWRSAYSRYFPTYDYPGVNTDGAPYRSWVIGRVRFIMTDGRTYMSDIADTDNSSKTKLGAVQKQWFKDEITAAKSASQMVVWFHECSGWTNTGPFVGDDSWAAFATERTELANHFTSTGMNTKMVLIHGDYHALAYDDGTNAPAGIPSICCSPLSQTWFVPGQARFSGGKYPATSPGTTIHQYGWFDVTDNGAAGITLAFTGYSNDDVSDTSRLTFSRTFDPSTPVAGSESNSLAISESSSLVISNAPVSTESNSLAVTESRQIDSTSSRTDTSAISVADSSSTVVKNLTTYFTEDFEGNLNSWDTVTQEGDGTIAITTGAAKTGTYGLASHVTANAGSRSNLQKAIPASSVVRASGWWRVTVEGAGGSNVPFLRLFNGSTRLFDVYRNNGDGKIWMRYTNTTSSTTYSFVNTNQTMALNTWAYVEFEYSLSGGIRVAVAGVDRINGVYPVWPVASIDRLYVGAEHTLQVGDFQVDDLTIQTDVAGTVNKSASDTGSIAAGDSSGITSTNAISASESNSLAVADSSALSSSNVLTASDTSAISVSESRTQDVSSAATESNSLAAADTSSSFRTIAGTESNSLAVNDISNIASTLPGTETTAVAVTEQTAILVTVSASESNSLAISESRTQSSTLSRTDTSAISVTESRTQAVTSSATDTGSIAAADASATQVFIVGTDTDGISVDEDTSGSNTVTATDTSAVSVSEGTTQNSTIDTDDDLTIGVVEAVSGSNTFATSDTGGIAVSESNTRFLTLTATDTSAVSVVDNANVFFPKPGSDTGSISVTETSSKQVSGGTTPAASDDNYLIISETTALFKTIVATDGAAVSVSESKAFAPIALSATDTGSLSVSEASTGSITGTASDTAAVSVSESRSFAPVARTATDGAAVSVSEQATPASQQPGSDAGSIAVTESRSIVVSGLITKSATDSAGISLGESHSMFIGKTATDTDSIDIAESVSFAPIAFATSDHVSLSVSDDIEIGSDHEADDTASISVEETAEVEAHEAISIIEVTDELVIVVYENEDKFDPEQGIPRVVFTSASTIGKNFALNSEHGTIVTTGRSEPTIVFRSSSERKTLD